MTIAGQIKVFLKDATIVLSDVELDTVRHALVEKFGEDVGIGRNYLTMFDIKAIIHVLAGERDRVAKVEGDQYGPMTFHELDDFILELRKGRGRL